MTLSYKSFEKIFNGERICAFWNSDGTILITQSMDGLISSEKSICLKPLEIENLLKENKFEYEGIRPGLIPSEEKIEASIINDQVFMKCTRFEKTLISSLSFPKTILEKIFISTKKVWEKNREKIRPLIGLNCKAGSFDAMEGKLDQDKINEELRVKVQNFLDSWTEE